MGGKPRKSKHGKQELEEAQHTGHFDTRGGDTDTDTDDMKGTNIEDSITNPTDSTTPTAPHEVFPLPSIPTPMNQHDAMILAFIASVQNALQNHNDLIRNLAIENTSLRHLQADLCKQGDELRKLGLEHTKLKNTVEMQAIRIAHLEAKLEGCNRDAMNVVTNEVMESRKACMHDVDKLKEHVHTLEKTYAETLGGIKQDMSQVKNVCVPKTWATRVMENPPATNGKDAPKT